MRQLQVYSDLEEVIKGRIIINDFGEDNGVHTFRINGLKDDLEQMVGKLYHMGLRFNKHPELVPTPSHRVWSLLLKIVIPR